MGYEIVACRLKFVKNLLRSKSTDERLNNLMILTCEKDILDNVNLDKLVEQWASRKRRKINILFSDYVCFDALIKLKVFMLDLPNL